MAPSSYSQTQSTIHHAVQLLTLIGNNLMDARPDDSQNTSTFDPIAKTLMGESFKLNETSIQAKIHLSDFSLRLEGIGKQLNLSESSWEEAKNWISDLFHIKNLKGINYDLPKDFWPDHYAFSGLEEQGLSEWIQDRKQANQALDNLNRFIGKHSEIRIWPHHFDTGTYYELAFDDDKALKSIGAGFAPPDSLVDEPYYYMYGWDAFGQLSYENRATLPAGRWIIQDNWKGVVLGKSAFQDASTIDDFFNTAQAWYRSALRL